MGEWQEMAKSGYVRTVYAGPLYKNLGSEFQVEGILESRESI